VTRGPAPKGPPARAREETRLATLLRELRRLEDVAERALAQVDDEAFFAGATERDNGIAITVKHLAGNMRSRWRDFLTSDGEKPDRQRDTEFVLAPGDTRAALMARWRAGWELVFHALEPLAPADLDRTVTIRGEPLTVFQAIVRQLAHYAYHVGQLVLTAKRHARGEWQSLSIPRGESARFGERPEPYV
jgi:hypothetical protein